MSNKLKFMFYTDPGHGWLRVPKKLLFDLGVHRDISTYSYHNGKYAYLEEDCDAGRLLDKLRAAGKEYEIQASHTNSDSRIRGFERFLPSSVLIG